MGQLVTLDGFARRDWISRPDPTSGYVNRQPSVKCQELTPTAQLRIEWSSPAWFYAPDETGDRITVARTDRDSVDKVDFADAGLVWYYLQCERERAKGASARAVPSATSIVTGEGLVLMLTVFDKKVPAGGAARVRVTIENRGPQWATVTMPPNIWRRGGWWAVGAYRFEIKGPTGSFRYVTGGQLPLGVPGPGRPETVTLRPGQSVGALFDVGVAAAETSGQGGRAERTVVESE